MNQKVAFFMFLNWSLFSFASHHKERIQEAQEFMQPDAVWFKVISTEIAYRDLILECHKIAHNPNLEGNIDFEQTELGILSVVYEQQRQQLGHFPNLRLKTHESMTEWYDDHKKTVRFLIPYTLIVIQKPL